MCIRDSFNSVGGITFGIGGVSVTLSGLAIAALAGILLNAILPGDVYKRQDIGRVLAGQGELCQAQRVGAEGRSLTGGDQLIGGGDLSLIHI